MHRVYAYEREVPARLLGAGTLHPLEELNHAFPLVLGNRVVYAGVNRSRIGVHTWWQPQCPTQVAVDVVGALTMEGLFAVCSGEAGEMAEVVMWIRPDPAYQRIRAECQNYDSND